MSAQKIFKNLKVFLTSLPQKAIVFYFLLCFFILVILVLFTPLANWVASPLSVKSQLEKADAIVVLSGGSYPNGVLALFTYDRLVYGLSLYKNGLASKIIMVGRSNPGGESDAALMKKIAVDLGFNSEDILTGESSSDTYENIIEAHRILEENKLRSALLVTSSIHMKRAITLAKKLQMDFYPAPVPSVDELRNDPADRAVLFYSEIWEIMATVFYKGKGWL